MRILIDECVHIGVKTAFTGHDAKTVMEMGWRSVKDGPLLVLAQDKFDVFVTIDRNLEYQQSLSNFKIGFLIVCVPRNELAYYLPIFNQLRVAAETVSLGEVIYVPNLPPQRGAS